MKIFLKLLSPSLRAEILDHIYTNIIKNIPLLNGLSHIEKRFIVRYMKTVIFLPSDEIIKQGDKGRKMYFISRGRVEVTIGPDGIEDQYELRRSNSKGSVKSHKSGGSTRNAGVSGVFINVEEKIETLSQTVSKQDANNFL